ncbi:uncharacterized protein LOC122812874 [Protopterus annectens]|uniref:uncharacterized protein LOC122812874 n=1 Tax=Protopterus annectens TaxID=7888 RepID=UPI001CFA3EF7|nr:uncharacterized protein LOC122812874 [Protopterus annectens]
MKAGSNVLLSCMFDTGESVIDLKHLTVTWTLQGGHTVAEFQYGEISTWKGVRLFKDGLSNGNASILIRKLTKADTGDYKCEVEYSAESAHQQMNLQIYEKELQVNVTPSKVQAIKGNNAVLNCTFTIDGPQFELEFLALRWLLGEKEVIRFSNIEIPNRTGAKLSNVMKGDASLLLPDIKTEDEGNYTCYVQYTPETAIQMLHLKVTDPEEETTKRIILKATSLADEEANVDEVETTAMKKIISVTEMMSSATGVKMTSVAKTEMNALEDAKTTLIVTDNKLIVLLKKEDYILLASLFVIVIVVSSLIIYVCIRNRKNYNIAKRQERLRA